MTTPPVQGASPTRSLLSMTHSDAVYRRAIAERLIEERHLLLDDLRRRDVLTLDVDAEHLSASVVNRYLQLKSRLAI